MKKKCEWTSCFALSRKQKMLIMKLQIVMMLFLSMQATASILSQQTVNIQLENATLKECIVAIEEQTDLGFLYNGRELGEIGGIYLNVHNKSVDMVLKEILYPAGYTYSIESNVILIKKAPPKPVIPQESKTITITGKVTDENGEPLPFVNIYIKGDTSQGVVTDQEGNYSITVEEKEGLVLIASFIGFLTKEFEVAGRTVINLMLKAEIADLSEVVVTGYQTISAERATGSFKNVKVSEVLKEKTSSNVFDVLEDEIPGLRVSEDLQGGKSMTIRGGNTLAYQSDIYKNNPLVVVDGFEITGTEEDFNVFEYIERISPNDIENVSVLKDAAAASIWGAKAANGVIVITTKRGKKSEKPVIAYNGSFSLQAKPDYGTLPVASINTLLEFDQWAADNGKVRPPSSFYASRPYSEGAQAYFDFINSPQSEADEDNLNEILTRLKNTNLVDEYSDLFLRTYTRQRHNVSISKATNKYSYYGSFNFDDEKSADKGVGSKSYNANLNFSTEVLKGVTVYSKLAFNRKQSENNGANPFSAVPQYQQILDEDGNYINQWVGIHQDTKDDLIARGYYPYDWDYNQMREFENKDNETENTNIDFQARINIDLYKGLKAELSYNYQRGRMDNEIMYNEETFTTRDFVNNSEIFIPGEDDGLPWTPRPLFLIPEALALRDVDPYWEEFWEWQYFIPKHYNGFGIPMGNIFDRSYAKSLSEGGRAQLSYNGYIGEKHHINAIAGIDYSSVKSERGDLKRLFGYDPQTLSHISVDNHNQYINRYGSPRNFSFGGEAVIRKEKNRYLSNYVNIGYTYSDKYSFTTSWRLDDSNLFGSSPKYRNRPLWSLGAKWQLGKEDFMTIDFIDKLDLRVSYGTGGTIDRNSSPYLMIKKWSDWQTGHPYASIRFPKNEELRWETTTTTNIGVDFALFSHRLFGSIEYYNKYTEDLLSNEAVNYTYGYSQLKKNTAELSNKGFNIDINYKVIKSGDINWLTSLNINHNKNKIEKYQGTPVLSTYYLGGFIEGESLYHLHSFKWAGLSETGAPQIYDENGEIVGHDVTVSTDALEYSGETEPKYYGSFKNTISYKGFTFSALIAYEFGHVFRRSSFTTPWGVDGTALHEDAELRWQKEGDELITNVPAFTTITYGNYPTYYERSNILIEDADNIRLQALSLNYRFNNKLFENTFIKNVSVGMDARNVGLIWTANKDNIDPRTYNNRYVVKPRPIYSFNLRMNF